MGGAAVLERSFGVTLRRVRPWIGLVLLPLAGLPRAGSRRLVGTASGCGQAASATRPWPPLPALRAVPRAAVPVPGNPFGVVATTDGRWSFVTLNSAVNACGEDGAGR